ncbi:hypothetical protein CIB95_09340 [Lottiidibacillus patelloidae]|uniref:Uncharacterized protein n=1 Tax=Lottiidibacillus patelloidae TaxID=2670334 RepID=A0A263BTB9_9BACI|nr:hypothetical protein [Lottiidibacillus patelloidae]OZM56964.1 hypothetical protein CIB95_09340 [Lottiidibacillus patelloidae]
MYQKLKSIYPLVIPIIILVLGYFHGMKMRIEPTHDTFIGLLIFTFPFLFFMQGLYARFLNSNLLYSLSSAVASYIIVVFVWLNSIALDHLIFYIPIFLLGYGTMHLIKWRLVK